MTRSSLPLARYDTVAMTLITAKAVAPREDDIPQLAVLPK